MPKQTCNKCQKKVNGAAVLVPQKRGDVLVHEKCLEPSYYGYPLKVKVA